MSSPTGFPVVLSAPSGGGKSTVAAALLEALPFLRRSRSLTTRPPRRGEVPGRDYEFVTDGEFDRRRAAGELAEWAHVHGHRYGTPRRFIDETCAAGLCPLLVIDVQGGRSVRRAYPDAPGIFLMPCALDETERRLRARASDPPKEVAMRMANARGEIAAGLEYDYIIVNESLDLAIAQAADVLRRSRESKEG